LASLRRAMTKHDPGDDSSAVLSGAVFG